MKQRAGLDKYIDIYETLKEIIAVKDGYAEYLHSWDDAMVAAKHEVSLSSVQSVRKGKFGKLRDHTISPNTTRLDDLDRQVRGHDTAISNLEYRISCFEKWARGHGFGTPNGRMHKEAS